MQKNELKSGVILSYINLGLGTVIPFIYTPIMLRMLGQAEYGLFSLASSAVSYLSLLSFGFGSTIIRYISKYRAEKDKKSEEKAFGFFLILYCVLALLVLLCGAIIANNVEAIFQKGLSANELKKMKVLVMIMTFNSALSFPNSVFSSMITANEKYIFRKLVDMFSTVLAPLANLVALYLGYASVGMATAATVVQFLMLPVNIYYCLRKLHIKPVIEKLPIALIKEMLGFSVFVFIGSIVDMLFWATDKVILGMLSGSVAVAIYNVGGTFNNMVMNLSTSISGVLTPRVTGMVVKDASKDELTNLFIRVGRLQFIVIALIVSGFTAFGQAFITLWAGKDYHDAYWVAILTMFPLCVPLIQNIGLTIVTAQNKHQFRYHRVSDITLGDFWGIWNINPKMDDNKGTSLILTHTAKGEKMMNAVSENIKCEQVYLEQAARENPSLLRSSVHKQNRDIVLKTIESENFQEILPLLQVKQPQRRSKKEIIKRVLKKLCGLG